MKRNYMALLCAAAMMMGTAPLAVFAEEAATSETQTAPAAGYTLQKFDPSGLLSEDCRLWSVERTEIGTYLLRGGFPHTYTYTDENGEPYTRDDYALYYAVADENGELIIPWFMHDTGGRGGSYMTYGDGVYSFINDEPLCYWDSELEGTVCEFYGEDGKPLFAHEDYVCAGQMAGGYAWVGVAGELDTKRNERKVKEYQIIDKTGTVLFTFDPNAPNEHVEGDYGLCDFGIYDGVIEVGYYDTVSGEADIPTLTLSYDLEGNFLSVEKIETGENRTYFNFDFKNGYVIAWKYSQEDGTKYGIIDQSGEIVVPFEYDGIYDFNENGYWAGVQTDPTKGADYAMYDWDGNPLTEALYFSLSEYSTKYSEDGYIRLRKFPTDSTPALNVLLDAQGREVTLPVETYRNEDYTSTELMGYDDGWLRFETYAGEKDENGDSLYTTRLVNWEGETLTFPTTKEVECAGNGLYQTRTNWENRAYFVLAPAEAADALKAGELTGDGVIDIMDVIKVNKYLLGSVSLSDAEKNAADVDSSGEVDSTDSLNILKYVVELITALPIA